MSQAKEEGWFLTSYSRRFSIEAYYSFEAVFSKPSPFKGTLAAMDNQALAFVQQKATEGSAYHIDALARTQLL